jgi:hypothetical protein
MDPPLAAHSKLLVGYGAANLEAFEFWLPDDVTSDVNFLRLFVSTTSVDMRVLEQSSPFFAGRGGCKKKPPSQPVWDAWTYVITTERQGIDKPT